MDGGNETLIAYQLKGSIALNLMNRPDKWSTISDLVVAAQYAAARAHDACFAATGSSTPVPGRLSMLMMVRQKPVIRQGVLARALRIKRAHVTKTVHAVEHAGHLVGTFLPDDRMSVELYLTPEGQSEAERAACEVRVDEAATPASLTAAEAATLRTLLQKHPFNQEHGHEPRRHHCH